MNKTSSAKQFPDILKNQIKTYWDKMHHKNINQIVMEQLNNVAEEDKELDEQEREQASRMTNQAPSSCAQFSVQASRIEFTDQPSDEFRETMQNTKKAKNLAGAFREDQNETKSDNNEHMITKMVSLS